jgi:hypothetical protein
MRRIVLVAGLVTLIAFGLPAAASAGNHQIFTDPAGDNANSDKPWLLDVTSTEVTSDDAGGISFRITINELNATFYKGDTLGVFLDTDSNPSTGSNGTDAALWLLTSSGTADYEFCNYHNDGTRDCTTYASSSVTNVATGPNTHVLTFSNLQSDWFTIHFWVYATWQDPANPSSTVYKDLAPDNGTYVYDVGADPDHDNLSGAADACPTIKGGRYDHDHDGCPDPLPKPALAFTWADSSPPVVSFRELRVTNAGPGTNVTARIGGRAFTRTGSGRLAGVAYRPLSIGTKLTIIYSSPTRAGTFRVLRVVPSGLATVRTGCTPRGSKTMLASCP